MVSKQTKIVIGTTVPTATVGLTCLSARSIQSACSEPRCLCDSFISKETNSRVSGAIDTLMGGECEIDRKNKALSPVSARPTDLAPVAVAQTTAADVH